MLGEEGCGAMSKQPQASFASLGTGNCGHTQPYLYTSYWRLAAGLTASAA